MTPETLKEMGRMYRLRHTVQRRVEYALLVCVLGVGVVVLQHYTAVNLRPLSFSLAGIAVVIGLSAWPAAIDHRRSRQRVQWMKSNEDWTRRIIPATPADFAYDTTPPLRVNGKPVHRAG